MRSCQPCARSNEVLFPPQTKFRVKEDLSSGKGVLQRKCFREFFPVSCELLQLAYRPEPQRSEEKDVQRVTENDETRDVHTRVLEVS